MIRPVTRKLEQVGGGFDQAALAGRHGNRRRQRHAEASHRRPQQQRDGDDALDGRQHERKLEQHPEWRARLLGQAVHDLVEHDVAVGAAQARRSTRSQRRRCPGGRGSASRQDRRVSTAVAGRCAARRPACRSRWPTTGRRRLDLMSWVPPGDARNASDLVRRPVCDRRHAHDLGARHRNSCDLRWPHLPRATKHPRSTRPFARSAFRSISAGPAGPCRP